MPLDLRLFKHLALGSAPGLLIAFGPIVLGPSQATAAYANYSSVLIGERAAGMGGAFTALTGDSSATPFYNPATTVLMSGNSLSAAVNVYNKFETSLGIKGDFNEGTQRLNRGYFRSLPSASGTILNFKSFAVGLSVLVPDYDFYVGQIRGPTDSNSFLNTIDESIWVGGTFSARLTSEDSVGLTLYYTARSLTRSASDRVTTGGGSSAVITNEEKQLTSNALVPILGYHRKLNDTWAIGISYRAPSLPISGDGSYYRSVTETSPFTTSVIDRTKLRAVTRIPARLLVGAAREVKGKNTVSFDAQFYEAVTYRDFPEFDDGMDFMQHAPVVNFALGYEQVLREWVTLRAGVFTNRSSHPEPNSETGFRQGDHVDMWGFSANLNFRTQDQTAFTLGGYYNEGLGNSTQLVGRDLTVVPKSQQIFTMLIATGFAF